MQAAVYDRFGPPSVLSLRELPKPALQAGEVLVKVRAAAINPKDALFRSGGFSWLAGRKFPMIPGSDFAGIVAEVAADVTSCKPGDAVYGMSDRFIGGCCAEYVAVPAGEAAPKPPSLNFIEAAALPLTALTALQALRDCGQVTSGAEVCIHGASGGVGSVAVQIAKAMGARVTALSSAANLEFVRALGADEVVDYRITPPTGLQRRFDCFFDTFGNQSFSAIKPLLSPHGTYVSTVPKLRNFIDHGLTRYSSRRRARLVTVRSRSVDLEQLSRWVTEGRLKPSIATVLPLSEIRQAHELIETRHTKGKIVLQVAEP